MSGRCQEVVLRNDTCSGPVTRQTTCIGKGGESAQSQSDHPEERSQSGNQKESEIMVLLCPCFSFFRGIYCRGSTIIYAGANSIAHGVSWAAKDPLPTRASRVVMCRV